MYHQITAVQVVSASKVEATDILDAVRTLRFASVLEVDSPAPGEGPAQFLEWAREEVEEAEAAPGSAAADRKAFNAAVQAKCAFECLIDWYLGKYLLDVALPPYVGLVRKLEALRADQRLGVGLALFSDVIAGPRNEAIHRYELVEVIEARRAYELAKLAIRNCCSTDNPERVPVFFGTLEFSRDQEAASLVWPKRSLGPDETAFYFQSVGKPGEFSVYFDRNDADTRIAVFEALKNGDIEARYCPVRSGFSPEQVNELFDILAASAPKPLMLKDREVEAVIGALSGRSPFSGAKTW
jgi:hypothetical protein